MRRRTVLLGVLAGLAWQGTAPAWADRGRGRGRGGDDGNDDDRDDDDEGDDGTDDNGLDDSDGRGVERRPSEVEADTLVIRYADGSVERIRGGRYQRMDAQGNVVESRPAGSAERARLASLTLGRGREMVIRIDSRRNEFETTDRRGWRELVAHGTYLLTDPNGNIVRRRTARPADIGRIRQLAGD